MRPGRPCQADGDAGFGLAVEDGGLESASAAIFRRQGSVNDVRQIAADPEDSSADLVAQPRR